MLRDLDRRWGLVAGFALVTAVVVGIAIHKLSFFGEVSRGDVIYDLAVAKSLARGQGFSTNLMPLGALEAAMNRGLGGSDPWPSLHKFLFAQALLAPLVRFFGVSIMTARIGSLVPYVVLVWVLFGVLERALRSVPLAVAFTLGFVCFNGMNNLALEGLNATTDTALFFGAIVLWLAALERPRLALLGGVVVGLCVLDRYSAILFVPLYVFGMLRSSGRRVAMCASVGVAIVLVPLFIWSWARFRLPLPSPQGQQLLLAHTKHLTTDPWYTSHTPHFTDHLGDAPVDLWRKIQSNVRATVAMLAETKLGAARNAVLGALAILGVLPIVRRRQDRRRVIVLTTIAYGALFVVVHWLLVFGYRYVVFLLPCIWLSACLAMHDLAARAATRWRVPPWLGVGALLAVMVTPELVMMREGETWLRNQTVTCAWGSYCNKDEINAYLRSAYPSHGLVIAGGDKPWDLAIATDNRVTPTLERPSELHRLAQAGVQVDLIFLPNDMSFVGDGQRPQGWFLWDAIRNAQLPEFDEYALRHVFSDGGVLYERGPYKAHALDYCSFASRIDMRRPADRIYLGKTFRYAEQDAGGAWAWIEGRTATLTMVTCGAARTLTLELLAAAPVDIIVRVNGAQVGGRIETVMAWSALSWPLPLGCIRDGVNDVAIELRSGEPRPLLVAFRSAQLTKNE